jgi:5'-methylthioadenosine phosphorylase
MNDERCTMNKERRMSQAKVGIIGGSGLYQIEGMTDIEEFYPATPWGKPSDALLVGKLDGHSVAFLPRHGRGHRISPTDLPARANIYAFKMLGVEWLLSVSAVGSLKEEIAPLDLVVPDQLIDRTRSRVMTFFNDNCGIVAHAGFAEPFCTTMQPLVAEVAASTGAKVHQGGTYICMEGPLFSTRAESNLYRSWGASIIGMTALPEAKLAREAEIHYAILACATDYDCWYEAHDTVTVEMVVATMHKNVERAKATIKGLLPRLSALSSSPGCGCDSALATAIMTDRAQIPAEAKEKYKLIAGKYL